MDIARLYDDVARDFDRDRSRGLMERRYLDEVRARLAPGGEILDLGCGTGEPIARHFIEAGHPLTGVDAAPAMLALARERFPDQRWLQHDMRSLEIGSRFAAIIAWDSFFHLTPGDQRSMFPVFARHAAAGTLLLFTSGPAAGVAMGEIYGRELYHASLDAGEYRELLSANNFRVVLHEVEDPACGHHTVWLAQHD
jgi:trans-aconitate methyltransferase